MIPALRGAAVVALREARRQSRRRSTWLVRAGLTALVLGLVLLLLVEEQGPRPPGMSPLGRELYLTWLLVTAPFAALAAPLLVGAAVLEEREDQTLELLALTRLPAASLFLGKIGSRLLALLTLILGTLPAVALVPLFGGVGTVEVVVALGNVVAASVALAAMAAFRALLPGRAALTPTMSALGWGLLLELATWVIWAMFGAGDATHLDPFVGAASGRWVGLLPTLTTLPALATLVALAAPVQRIATSDDQEHNEAFGEHSLEFWDLERYRTRTGVAFFAVVVATCAGLPAQELAPTGVAAASLVALAVVKWWLTRVWMLAALRRAVQKRTPPIRWTVQLEDAPPRRVWGNPVTWRDLRTRAHPGEARALRGLAWAWVAALAFGLWFTDGSKDVRALLAFLAALGALGLAPGLAVASTLEERRARTFDLLRLTPLGAGGIVRGKLGGVVGRVGPWVFAAWVLMTTVHQPTWGPCEHAHLLGPMLPFPAWSSVAGMAAWTLVVTLELAAFGVVIALVAPTQVAWALALTAPMAWMVVEGLLVTGAFQEDPSRLASALWLPLGDEDAWSCAALGLPRTLVASIALHGFVAAVLSAFAARRVARD